MISINEHNLKQKFLENFHPQKEYAKHYDSHAEEMHRFQIFVRHKHHIDEHNLHYENGGVSFKMGFNENSDLDDTEWMTGQKVTME